MRTLALTCLLLSAVSSISQDAPLGVNGVVLTYDDKPISGAFVLLRDYQRPNRGNISDTWETRTSADGSFSFAAPTGCYDIFVSANTQFLPTGQRICVQR